MSCIAGEVPRAATNVGSNMQKDEPILEVRRFEDEVRYAASLPQEIGLDVS